MKNSLIFLVILIIGCSEKNEVQYDVSSDLENGLVAYYPMDSILSDKSQYKHNGIIYGAVLTSNRLNDSNTALLFDGIDDYVLIPDSIVLQPKNEISLCAWVYPISFNDESNQANDIIHKGFTDDGEGAYYLRYNDFDNDNEKFDPEKEYFGFTLNFENMKRVFISSTTRVLLNNWYFVVGTYDGDTMRLYINGNLESQIAYKGNRQTNTRNLTIGRNEDSNNPYFVNGKIDDIRIYERALTNCEIKSLYHAK